MQADFSFIQEADLLQPGPQLFFLILFQVVLNNCLWVDLPGRHDVSTVQSREHSGLLVECLTQDRGAEGWSLTGVTVLWSLSKIHLS